eukprot:SAG22_NODE_1461_length_4369_cov_4.685012_2_plen_100_part_00
MAESEADDGSAVQDELDAEAAPGMAELADAAGEIFGLRMTTMKHNNDIMVNKPIYLALPLPLQVICTRLKHGSGGFALHTTSARNSGSVGSAHVHVENS